MCKHKKYLSSNDLPQLWIKSSIPWVKITTVLLYWCCALLWPSLARHMYEAVNQGPLLRRNPQVRVTSGKTLYQDYLHRIANFCTTVLNIFSKESISNNTKSWKQILKFIWNTWKYWWNDSDNEILSVFAQFLWTLKFIFSCSNGKLFLVLFQATICIFSS